MADNGHDVSRPGAVTDSEAYAILISKLDDNLLWHEAVHVFWRGGDRPLGGTTKGEVVTAEIVGRWMASAGREAVRIRAPRELA